MRNATWCLGVVMAIGLLSAGCNKDKELTQADCDKIVKKADDCKQAGVKAELDKWCKANVGKKFDSGIFEFKSTGYLEETCERLPGRLPDFSGWTGK